VQSLPWNHAQNEARSDRRPLSAKEIDVRVVIPGQGMGVDTRLTEHIQRALSLALTRFSNCIREVVVRLAEISRVQGGMARYCSVTAHLIPTGAVVVADTDSDLLAVVERAVDRAGQAVAQELRLGCESENHTETQTCGEQRRRRNAFRAFWYQE
jgi:hypothetical protein